MRETMPTQLLELARAQGGLITRKQALQAGLTTNSITGRVVHKRWTTVHRGVYATFTGPLTRHAELWAALLSAGPGARLSHQTAGELIRLIDRESPSIHVTIPATRRVRPPHGVVIHLSSRASAGWRFALGVPAHTLAEETIIDLVHAATRLDEVVGYVTAALARDLSSAERLHQEAAARKKLRWRAELNEIIQNAADGAHSVLEYRYDRDVAHAHGLPSARNQAPFAKPSGRKGRRDRYYQQYRLIIELDGRQFHPEERRGLDQSRDNDATATGAATLRYGWDDVTRRPCTVAAQVHAALAQRGYPGPLVPCSPACGARPLLVPTGAAPPREG